MQAILASPAGQSLPLPIPVTRKPPVTSSLPGALDLAHSHFTLSLPTHWLIQKMFPQVVIIFKSDPGPMVGQVRASGGVVGAGASTLSDLAATSTAAAGPGPTARAPRHQCPVGPQPPTATPRAGQCSALLRRGSQFLS